MVYMNVFRILGDVSHTLSKCVLIWAIHWNKSAEGVSLITQILYALVFLTRYVDLLWFWRWDFSDTPWLWYWNFVLKNFYIWSSLYIILLMGRVYARTRERERAWKMGAVGLGGSVMLAPVMTRIFLGKSFRLIDLLWAFSEILESVCVLPQLLLLRQTTVPTVIDSYYLLLLGSYRALYILNWIVRAADPGDIQPPSHPIAIIFGVIQTILYLDFAWVYYSRQRVKLRGGGVVDSDDFRNSWLLRVIFGRRDTSVEDGEGAAGSTNGAAAPHQKSRGRWGARGISVSADEGVAGAGNPPGKAKSPARDSNATADELVGILEEDDEDFQDQASSPDDTGPDSKKAPGGINTDDNALSTGENEWRR